MRALLALFLIAAPTAALAHTGHGDDMVDANHRVHEAVHEPRGVAMPGMGKSGRRNSDKQKSQKRAHKYLHLGTHRPVRVCFH